MITLHLPYLPSGWDLYNDWDKTAARPHPVRSGGTPPATHQGLKQAIASRRSAFGAKTCGSI
ncbi:hypothetical protein GOC09_27045 [Sinorhizobium meliloti]|nr:hypothetical protein [Sinorhizobium meliloti]MDW9837250.1 hypothetical protein [Sinorhizobium meliloti]MDX0041527.1 hypothetical protein [Sinorhizobium meliloti]MDX0090836.1 hypothetical protein [Sinorhizobium meliloti]